MTTYRNDLPEVDWAALQEAANPSVSPPSVHDMISATSVIQEAVATTFKNGPSLPAAERVWMHAWYAVHALCHPLSHHDRMLQEVREVVEAIVRAGGHVMVSGLGKSAIAAQRLAATLCAVGQPAHCLHPVDMLHGDIGGSGDQDTIWIFLSRSGETQETLQALRAVQAQRCSHNQVVAITEREDSTMARAATWHIMVRRPPQPQREAARWDAPTTSLTAMGVVGDMVAVGVQEARGQTRAQYARLHPGGVLGRRHTKKVEDVMDRHVPSVAPDTPTLAALCVIGSSRGTVCVFSQEDPPHRLLGVVTAGDIGRYLQTDDGGVGLPALPVETVMTRDPHVVSADTLAITAVQLMEEHGIMAMPVLDHNGPAIVGLVHLHDALRAGVGV